MDLKNGKIRVKDLLANPKARALLNQEFPKLMNSPLVGYAGEMTLQQVLSYAGYGSIPKAKIDAVLKQLEKLQ